MPNGFFCNNEMKKKLTATAQMVCPMLIKIYRGETNCSLAETQSMGQTNLHDYEYS